MYSDTHPTIETSLSHYFHNRFLVLAEELDPKPQEDTLWYIGNMLARFGDSEQLFSYQQGEVTLRPFALLYQDAYQASDEWERCLLLRQLGDMALFLGSLFPENFAKRGIHQDYFIGMGGGAYDYLSDNARHHRHVFSELANAFSRMQLLIAQACCKDSVFDATDILNLYHRWEQTKDARLAAQLESLGISLLEDKQLH